MVLRLSVHRAGKIDSTMFVKTIIPGNPVRVAFDLTAHQIAACAHVLGREREGRYRLAEMSVDDVLALRDLTVLIDRFELLSSHGAHDQVQLTAAHVVRLSDVVRDFMLAQAETDVVRPDSRPHLATAGGLVDPLADLAHEALQAAMADLPELEIDPDGFDSLLGGSSAA
jgi:hypothetical protein